MANKLEVTLSFKPLMDGLNRFASAIENRLERVRAYNLRIENGAKATNQLLSQTAAAFGGLQVVQVFTGLIKGGVGFNEQLEQAELGIAAVLKQFDSAGKYKNFDDALKASAAAIELLKVKAKESPASFSDLVQAFQGTAGAMAAANIPLQKQVDLVVTMSQTLAGLGIRSEQILQETRALITGNINADAAAAKILGITSADISSAKQRGQLYEFLTGKVAAFGEAARRGAGSLATLRSNFGDVLEQRMARATERVNDALKGLFATLSRAVETPAFAALVDGIGNGAAAAVGALTRIVDLIANLGPNGTAAVGALVRELTFAATVAATVLVPLVAIRGIIGGLPMLLNPVRVAMVAILGLSFGDALRDLQLFSRELGLLTTLGLASWAQRAAFALGVLGAAFIGWELGGFINELTVGGAKVKDWAAMVVNSIVGLFEALGAWKDVLRVKAISTASEAMAKLKELYWQGALSIVEALNSVLGRFGKAIPTDGLKQAVAEARAELKKLSADNEGQIRVMEAHLANVVSRRGETGDFIEENAFGFQRPEKGDRTKKPGDAAATAGTRPLDDKERQAREELEFRRWLYDQETAIREAQLDGNRELVDQLTRERDERQALLDLGAEAYEIVKARLNVEQEERDKKRAADLEKIAAEKELSLLETRAMEAEASGNAAVAEQLREHIRLKQLLKDGSSPESARARLEAEKALQAQTRARLTEEQQFSSALGELALERAAIEGDRYRTTEQKQRALLPLLQRENELIAARLELLTRMQNNASPEERVQLQQQIDGLRSQQAGNAQTRTAAEPQTLGDGAVQGVSGQGGFLDSLGTAAQNAAQAVSGTLNTALQSTSDLLYNLVTGTMTFSQAWTQATLQVGQQFLRMATDMVAKMIWRATVEKALIALGVTTHVAGEAAKTAATTAGGGIRLGVMVKEALASVYKGAVQAFEALSSIPYVGPFLGAAAMAAALAGGIALVGKIAGHADGGLIEGPGSGTSDSIVRRLSDGEFVTRASVVDRFGVGFFDQLNSGVLDLAQLPDNVTRGMAVPASVIGVSAAAPTAAPDGGGKSSMDDVAGRITVINVSSEREATRIARQSRARGDIVRIVNEEFGLPKKRG